MTVSNNLPKFILATVCLFTLITGTLIFFHPPAVYPDPSWGFKALRCMQAGGKFNVVTSPNPANIAQNTSGFLSWWSPGQYLVPYFFISILPINLAQGTVLAIIFCSLIGLWGLYAFFKKIGFSTPIAAISIAFIACQQFFIIPYIFYNGGEVILFAFIGWFLYGCTHFNKPDWRSALFILLSGVIGFFCKSSFLWIYFSGVLYWWIRSVPDKKGIAQWFINGIWAGLPVIAAIAIIVLCYLSKGDNPAASTDGATLLKWETFSFPMAAPLLAGFSIDEITNGLSFHNALTPVFSVSWAIVVMVLLAIASLTLVIIAIRKIPYNAYKLLLIIFYIACVLFFGINFLRQASISFEARHMRVIGLIIIPAAIYLVSQSKIIIKVLFGLAWLYIAFTTQNLLRYGYSRDKAWSAHGATGFSQVFIDQPTLDYISTIDRKQHNAIFVFNTPDVALEIQHNRIINFEPLNDNLKAENELAIYNGHAGPVYLVLPKTYVGARANVYIKNFPDYKNFCMQQITKNYVIYQAQ